MRQNLKTKNKKNPLNNKLFFAPLQNFFFKATIYLEENITSHHH